MVSESSSEEARSRPKGFSTTTRSQEEGGALGLEEEGDGEGEEFAEEEGAAPGGERRRRRGGGGRGAALRVPAPSSPTPDVRAVGPHASQRQRVDVGREGQVDEPPARVLVLLLVLLLLSAALELERRERRRRRARRALGRRLGLCSRDGAPELGPPFVPLVVPGDVADLPEEGLDALLSPRGGRGEGGLLFRCRRFRRCCCCFCRGRGALAPRRPSCRRFSCSLFAALPRGVAPALQVGPEVVPECGVVVGRAGVADEAGGAREEAREEKLFFHFFFFSTTATKKERGGERKVEEAFFSLSETKLALLSLFQGGGRGKGSDENLPASAKEPPPPSLSLFSLSWEKRKKEKEKKTDSHPLWKSVKSAGNVFFFARSPEAPRTATVRVRSHGTPGRTSSRVEAETRRSRRGDEVEVASDVEGEAAIVAVDDGAAAAAPSAKALLVGGLISLSLLFSISARARQ